MNVSDRIRAEAKKRGLSLEELAERLGVDYSTLWRKCNGKIRLDVEFLKKIAEILGVSSSYLLDGVTIAEKPFHKGEDTLKSEDETALLFLYRSLSAEKKEQIIRIMRAL